MDCFKLVLTVVVILTAVINVTTAAQCNCTGVATNKTLKSEGCKSTTDFVIVANITRKDLVTLKGYEALIPRVLKVNSASQPLLDACCCTYRTLFYKILASAGTDCEVNNLVEGKIYVMTGHVIGGQLVISQCDFIDEWANIPYGDRARMECSFYSWCRLT